MHNTPGSGFLEKVYQNSLVIELQTPGFSVEVEKPITVYYHDEVVVILYVRLSISKVITHFYMKEKG